MAMSRMAMSSTYMSSTATRVVMVGKTGSGKSSLGNTLLGDDLFNAQSSFRSVTELCDWRHSVRFGTELQVTDTPGVSDTQRDEDVVMTEIAKSIGVASPGPHVILMVIRFGRFTVDEYNSYLMLKALFGEHFTKFVIVVVTGADDMKGDTPEARNQWFQTHLNTAPDTLKTLLGEVSWRYFVISNKDPRPQRDSQASRLLNQIQVLIGQNGNEYFTNAMFQEMTGHVNGMVQRRMERSQQPVEQAVVETRDAIIKNEEEPGFFQKYGKVIKAALKVAAALLLAVCTVVLSKCSIM